MASTALDYYELIMDRVCHVLGQRLRGKISYVLDKERKGFVISILLDDIIYYELNVLYTDLEANSAESNRCVLYLADKFIKEYKQYIEHTIVYRENSI